MVLDATRTLLRRSLCLLRAVLLAVLGGARKPLIDSLVDTVPAVAVPVIARVRVLAEQFTASVGASRAPPAPLA